MSPHLEPLPEYRKRRIVVGTTVRKSLPVLKAYLDSLDWQERDERTAFEYAFIPDFPETQRDALEYLLRWVNERKGTLIQGVQSQVGDFSDANGAHQWGQSAIERVRANKNTLIRFALDSKADALWLVDADLILDRTTFQSLDAADKPIVTATYWTRWGKQLSETQRIYAAPQVWLTHPYNLSGRGMDEAEFRQKLLSRELTRVWGYGACTLIQRRVLEAGVNFDAPADVPQQGMMAWEDRAFCINAERRHIDAYADNWSDVFHVYHADEDVARIPEMVARLGAPHPVRARIGDLVSLRLRPLEPIAVGPGRYQQCQPQLARGRLGALSLLPEIEEAVHGLTRGERTIVKAVFPVHHPMPQMRGRRRLIECTLLDVKEFGYPPVVEEDLLIGTKSGRIMGADDAA